MNFFKELSVFQKIFLVFFIIASIVSFFIPLMMGQSSFIGLFGFISIIGLISSISGVLASIYQVRASAVYYLWFILNTITYAIVCLNESLYAQFIQNLFILLPLEIIGFIAWKRHIDKSEHKKLTIKKFTASKWVMSIIAVVILWIVYAAFIKSLPYIFSHLFNITIQADPQFKLDSLTAVTTIFAVYITSKRYLEQWYFWIVANAGIILFIKNIIDTGVFSMSDLSGAIVLGQYGVISFYGLYCWLKMYKKQKEAGENEANEKLA